MEKDGTFTRLPKKEVLGLRKELAKLEKFLSGIKDMRTLPQAVFVVDPMKEKNAVLEARKLKIPVFGIVDTNCDPDLVDVIIPANDDAIRSVKLIVGKLANAFIVATGGEVVETEAPTLAPGDKKPYVKKPYEKKPYEKKPYEKKPFVKKPFTTERKAFIKDRKPSTVASTVPSEAKPAVKVEAKPAVKVEAKPVVKVEAKPVVKETKKVVTKSAPVKEVKPEVKETKKAVTKSAPVKEAKPEVKETKLAKKPAAKPAAKPVAKKVAKKVEAKVAVDLSSMKVTELRALAKEKGLTGYSKLVKADLIKALK